MKKQLLSIITILALCLTMLPATAWAVNIGTHIPGLGINSVPGSELLGDTYYQINTDGLSVTPVATGSAYNFYYDSATATLTLQDAVLTQTLYVPYGTTINLVGDNQIGTTEKLSPTGIQVSSGTGDTAVTVTGTGSLIVYSNTEGIDGTGGNIVINGGTIQITNKQSAPIYTRNGSITIGGDAKVTVNSGSSAISCAGDLTITENATVAATNTNAALYSSKGKIVISGKAQVTATATVACAIEGNYGLEILDEAFVKATGKTGALNSFYGSIVINGTAEATLTGQPTNSNGAAAVSVGTDSNSTGAITVGGKLTAASTFAGIWTVGTGNIIIDGGNVSITAPYGLLTRMGLSQTAEGGDVTIQNNGTLTITGAMGTYPQGSCTLTVDKSTVNINTSSWGLYWPGQIVLKDSTITCANTAASNKAIGTATSIDYQYTDGYSFMAGASAAAAELISEESQSSHLQDSYVKIEPVPTYSITVSGGSASSEKAIAGATITVTAEVPDGQLFDGWTADNENVVFADATAVTTTFSMPASNVTVTAATKPIPAKEISSITVATQPSKLTYTTGDALSLDGLTVQVTYSDGSTESISDVNQLSATPANGAALTVTENNGKPVTITYGDQTCTTASLTVQKGSQTSLTISGVPEKIYSGDSFTLTAEGGSGTGEISWLVVSGPAEIAQNGKLVVTGAGEIQIKAMKAADGEYAQAESAITFTAAKKSSTSSSSSGGGSSSVTYPVAVEDTAHGSINLDRTGAASGTTVSVTVIPNEGYKLQRLLITDKNGKEISVTSKGNDKYTFVMPVGGSTINAEFVKLDAGYASCSRSEACPIWLFTDASATAWYHDGIHYCIENGLMGGYGQNLFGPNDALSRAQLAQILYNREGKPAVSSDGKLFTDVADSAWYTPAIAWAATNGIVVGYGDGLFGPDDAITREQLAVILWRYAQLKGYDITQGGMAIREFSDYESISDYAINAMTWTVNSGIIGGYEDKTLQPQSSATRAQAAQILKNFLADK